MKKYMRVMLFVLVSILLFSCNKKRIEMQEQIIAELGHENDSLRRESQEKENVINDFFESLNQIRENLNEIKVRQNMISEETRDQDNIGQNTRQQIDVDLAAINELMEDNRKRLAQLNRQLGTSNVKIKEFEVLIASLTTELDDKNIELNNLRASLEELNTTREVLAQTIEVLEEQNYEQQAQLEQRINQLNTAWYIFGTRRELREQQIINLQGGLLGIGRRPVINSDYSTDKFTRVNIEEVDRVVVPGKSVNVLSLHPNDSYIIEDDGRNNTTIYIEDPDKFWSNTKHLIVSVE
jgi:septal ring factor EnvC (AmiA/AmiB activator)